MEARASPFVGELCSLPANPALRTRVIDGVTSITVGGGQWAGYQSLVNSPVAKVFTTRRGFLSHMTIVVRWE